MFVRIDACISEQQTDTLSVMSHTTASPKFTLALTKMDNPIDANCLKNISLYFWDLNTSWHYVFLLERPRKLIGAQVVDKERLLLLLINIILFVCVYSVNMYIVPLFLIIFLGIKSPYFCIETSSVITHQAFDRSARWCTREGWCTSFALWISPRR